MDIAPLFPHDEVEDHATRCLSIMSAAMVKVDNEYHYQCGKQILQLAMRRPYADAYIELANAQKRLRRKYNITPLPGSPKWVLEILSACRRQKKMH